MLVMVVLVSFSAIYFNLMLNRHEVLYKNSYLPALFYVLFSSALPEYISVHPLHFANLLLVRVLDLGYSLSRSTRPAGGIFGAGFLTSLIVLLSLHWFVMAFYFLVMLGLMRSAGLREWLIAFTGLLLPFFFLAVWWFPETLQLHWVEVQTVVREYRFEPAATLYDKAYWLTAYSALLLLSALLRLRGNYYKNIVRTRVYQQTILILLLTGIAMAFSSGRDSVSGLLVLIIPLATFLSYYFVTAKRRIWLPETMLWGLVALIFWNRFF
ncbi:MAG: hypothetical protein RL213_393 [Bacteroidota bacterium]